MFPLEYCFSKFNQSNNKLNSFGPYPIISIHERNFLEKSGKWVYKNINLQHILMIFQMIIAICEVYILKFDNDILKISKHFY